MKLQNDLLHFGEIDGVNTLSICELCIIIARNFFMARVNQHPLHCVTYALKSGVADYVIFFITSYDIIFLRNLPTMVIHLS